MNNTFSIRPAIRNISRILTGLVFIFSGFVKGVDLIGSVYKFQDYFNAFHLDFLNFMAAPLAAILVLAEFLIGLSLIMNLKVKYGLWGALIFMSLFTPLTLVLALTNPVSDCGCFGDALVLTNWETFLKNLVIVFFTIMAFIERKKFQTHYSVRAQWMILGIFALFIAGIANYGLKHLPLIDFRPYKVGTSIPEGRIIPEDAPVDRYETTLIYEKNGVQKEFTMEDFPWEDSTWVFVDQRSQLLEKGYEPPIRDFNILTPDGLDLTEEILEDQKYSLIFISTQFEKSNTKGLVRANDLALYSVQAGMNCMFLTSSSIGKAEEIAFNQGLYFKIYNMDETTLKTIVRSNPGLIILKEGVIIGKYSWRDFPEPDYLSENILAMELAGRADKFAFWRIFGISVCMLFFLALISMTGILRS